MPRVRTRRLCGSPATKDDCKKNARIATQGWSFPLAGGVRWLSWTDRPTLQFKNIENNCNNFHLADMAAGQAGGWVAVVVDGYMWVRVFKHWCGVVWRCGVVWATITKL